MILGSALAIMVMSLRMKVNGWEWTFIRGGFSLYSGWLTIATILNLTAMLTFFGFRGFDWYSEEAMTITMLYIAGFIYNLASYIELNPLYGAVFVWVCLAIRSDIITDNKDYADLQANVSWIGILHALSMTGLAGYLGAMWANGLDTIPNGLFY